MGQFREIASGLFGLICLLSGPVAMVGLAVVSRSPWGALLLMVVMAWGAWLVWRIEKVGDDQRDRIMRLQEEVDRLTRRIVVVKTEKGERIQELKVQLRGLAATEKRLERCEYELAKYRD